MLRKILLAIALGMPRFIASAHAGETGEMILASLESVSPATIERTFTVPPFGVEHQVRLSLEARIDWRVLAGSNPWIRVAVNGTFLTQGDLLNKRDEFRLRSGMDATWSKGDRWRVLYSPDFERAIREVNHPHACPDADPYHYVWNVTPYVQPGKNTLCIVNLQVLAKPTTLVLRNVKLEVGRPQHAPAEEAVAQVPTGPLPEFVASGPQKVPMTVRLAHGGSLRLAVAGREFAIGTRTSLPAGKWHETADEEPGPAIAVGQSGEAEWTTPSYRVRRRVAVRPDHVELADTLTNTTDSLIGVRYENRIPCPDRPTAVRLGGHPAMGESARFHDPANPSLFAAWKELGLGLVAVDDVFRVHHTGSVAPGLITLEDSQLGVDAGKSIVLEWSIYPVPGGDYWHFVNAVRRDWDTNFTVPGPFSFTMHFRGPHPADWYGDWVRKRALKIVAGGIATYPNGRYAHGTGILQAPQWVAREKDWIGKMTAAAPEVKALCYFHAQCSGEADGESKYADSRLINDRGEHLAYPYHYRLPLYVPTRENRYGKALWGYVRTCLDEIGASGLYWDEMSYSVLRFAYQGPWDGCTVVIDPKTHAVVGKRSSVALLMQPLELDIVNDLRQHKNFLMANTQANTRTMLREKIVRFVEAGSYSAVLGTHLACPLGLGNHHQETTQADSARQVREFLKLGALYYGWQYERAPAAWNFTEVMFPITPAELHEGVVLGEERIHTARSGRFGWPDGAAADVYVVDGQGNRAAESMVRETVDGGRRRYEIRMPGDHFAVLVKRR